MTRALAFICPLLALPLVALLANEPRKPYGIDQRIPWTGSRVVGAPDPPPPYDLEIAFPKLPKFDQPLDLVRAPGFDRLFVAETKGRILSFPNKPDVAKADVLLETNREVYGLAFHPDFQKNGYFYVSYSDPKPAPRRNRISRFQVSNGQAQKPGFSEKPGFLPKCNPDTEHIILEFPSDGHNGGCLQFGPDGYLYIATGDGSGIGDEYETGQFLGDLLSSILRIDANRSDSGKSYGIPPDNPFAQTPGVRPEIWAYGLRQPWKFSFDRQTGALWAGEVGQDLWEMIYIIQKGGNYGWSVTEGSRPFRPERKRGPSPILQPIVDHPHSDARSITGGYVYRGSRLKELSGAYIYGDYETGKIWGLRYDGRRVTWQQELADTALHIVGFGEDHAGELYVLAYEGTIHRLIPAPKRPVTASFPRKLSETGLFASTKDHRPAPGLIPYSVAAPLWSDHAYKERFIALPGDSKIEFDLTEGWTFPEGSVLVKTFSLDLEHGNAASRRRLETRLLSLTEGHWRGYTYLWNDAQTDAELLSGGGLDRAFEIRDARSPGGVRKQTWHFPSRAECTLCHTMPARFVLGLNTLQMNKDHHYGSVNDNQLRTLEHIGVFSKPLPKPPQELPSMVDPLDNRAALDKRARSYLHANCSHCHRQWGGGNAKFQLQYTLDLDKTDAVNVAPAWGNFGVADARILVPGSPERSLLYQRMTKTGLGRMPHIASSVVDDHGVALIREWIRNMPKEPAKVVGGK